MSIFDDDVLEVDRDRYGRPLIVPPGGGAPVPYTRASTYCKVLDDSYGLALWRQRHLALGVGKYPDLAAMLAPLNYEQHKRDIDAHIETAIDRVGLNSKANHGTAVHSFTEPGAPVELTPARMRPTVDAYTACMQAEGIETIATELFVVCDELQVAGTLDNIYMHPVAGYVVGDKKSGDLRPHSFAVQAAIYAHGSIYNVETGERTPTGVRTDWALIVHLPRQCARCAKAAKASGVASELCLPGCDTPKVELHWIDLAAGWDAARRLVPELKAWQGRKDLLHGYVAGAGVPVIASVMTDTDSPKDPDEQPPATHPVPADPAPAPQPQPEPAAPHVDPPTQPLVAVDSLDVATRDLLDLTPESMAYGEAMREVIAERIATATSAADLTAIWREANAEKAWTDEHTTLAKARTALLNGGIPTTAAPAANR